MCTPWQQSTGSKYSTPVSLPEKRQEDAPFLKNECISKECGLDSKPEKQTTNMDAPWAADILGSATARF